MCGRQAGREKREQEEPREDSPGHGSVSFPNFPNPDDAQHFPRCHLLQDFMIGHLFTPLLFKLAFSPVTST